MKTINRLSLASLLLSAVCIPLSATIFWQDPGNLQGRDLLLGPGGKDGQPSGKFTFVKADNSGTTPKFDVVDSNGVHWKVKLGEEARSETAAARLLWAIGYIADEDYYLPSMQVENMGKVRNARKFINSDGIVKGARLERIQKNSERSSNWSWHKNSGLGSREFDGLRVMMALMNNWDLKKSNNSVVSASGAEPRYLVSDLGATFGRTGNTFVRSKSNVGDYTKTKFIQKVKPEHVDFYLSSRPFFLTVFHLPNYVKRTRMQGIVKNVPRAHAIWIGQLLSQLSPQQLRDCFVASGYSEMEAARYAQVVEARISELNRL